MNSLRHQHPLQICIIHMMITLISFMLDDKERRPDLGIVSRS
jgi:hypothetical protein